MTSHQSSSRSDTLTLHRVPVTTQFADLSGANDILKVAILDVETTGMDHDEDKVIELGMSLIEFSPSMEKFGRVLQTYNGLESPGVPLSETIIRVTGITDADLESKTFDDEAISRLAGEADWVIAHNSSFDRLFVERRFPDFASKPWMCSYKEGPWEEMGIGTAKLEFLVFKVSQAFYDAHRATDDVQALAHLLMSPGVNGRTVIGSVFEQAQKFSYRVWATGAPFDIKDVLKKNGYRWTPEDQYENGKKVAFKSWGKDMLSRDELKETLAHLSSLYPGGKIVIDKMSAHDRFSKRATERRDYVLARPAPLEPTASKPRI